MDSEKRAKQQFHQQSQQPNYAISMAELTALIYMAILPVGSGCPHRVVGSQKQTTAYDKAIHLDDTCQSAGDLHTYKRF